MFLTIGGIKVLLFSKNTYFNLKESHHRHGTNIQFQTNIYRQTILKIVYKHDIILGIPNLCDP